MLIKELVLRPVIDLDTESQYNILSIRNEDNIRKWMYSSDIIATNDHLNWIHTLKKDTTKLALAVLHQNNPIGLVSLSEINTTHKTASWAFYITELQRGGIGAALEYYFINYVFDHLDIEKLSCEVLVNNTSVLSLHNKFGFVQEGCFKAHIKKEEGRIDVIRLALFKHEWLKTKERVATKYEKLIHSFDFICDYHPNEPLHPIDKIEQARAKNNLNWMSILRLALEKSPSVAGPIVSEIKRLDKDISSLTDELDLQG